MKTDQTQGTVALVGGAIFPEVRRAVERRGLRAYGLSFQEEALAATPDEPVIVGKESIDVTKTIDVVRRLLVLDARYGFKAIVPVGEYGLLASVVAAIKLGLPAPPLSAVTSTRDKLRMRRAVDHAGLPQPRWAGCETERDAAAFLRAEDGPIVVKPAWGSGSEAISLVTEPGQLADAFARIRVSRPAGPVLCEQFVDGPEVSLEGYTVDGRFVPVAVTDKRTGQHFVETGQQQPSSHPQEVQEAVFSMGEKILKVLKVDQAVSHTEFRLSAEGPMLIESHTRMGGDWIHVLTAHTQGVDLADLTVGLALGERQTPVSRPTGRGCAVRFLTGGSGRLLSIEAPEPSGDILMTRLQAQPGDVIEGCHSSLDRLVQVVATGDTAAAAADTAERYLEGVEVLWSSDPAQRQVG